MSGTVRTDDGHGRLGNALSGLAVAVGCVLFLGGFVWGAVVYQPYTRADRLDDADRAGRRPGACGADRRRPRCGAGTSSSSGTSSWGDMPMVKRVVGVGGDTVACCGDGGKLTVNGKAIEEPYLRRPRDPRRTVSRRRCPRGSCSCWATSACGSLDSRVHLRTPARGRCRARPWRHGWTPWPGPWTAAAGAARRLRRAAGRGLPAGAGASWSSRSLAVGAALIVGGAAYGPHRAQAVGGGVAAAAGAGRKKATAGVG